MNLWKFLIYSRACFKKIENFFYTASQSIRMLAFAGDSKKEITSKQNEHTST